MVSTRRSGSLSSNNNTSTSSAANTAAVDAPAKKSSSSADNTPPSPKRLKVENSGKRENSTEVNVSPPLYSSPAVNDGGDGVAGTVPAPITPVMASIPDGHPLGVEFLPLRNHQKQTSYFSSSTPWCRLLTQYAQNASITISSPEYTIGSSRQCNLVLKDHTVSGLLCKIRHTQRDGCIIAVLESTGSKGTVLVNGMAVKKNTSRLLHSGDEVVLGVIGSHSYIFQQLVVDSTAKKPLSIGNAEVKGPVGKYLPGEKRSRDHSVVAGATILASLSNFRPDLTTHWKTGDPSTPKLNHDAELSNSTHAVIQDGSEIEFDEMEGNSTPKGECDNAVDIGRESKNFPLDFDTGCLDTSNVLEERNEWTRSSLIASTSGASLRCATFKEDIHAGILDGNAIEVSFDDFPYYLSENTKSVLIAAAYIHLKHKDHVKYTSDLPTVNPRILLSGPSGSEIYQEMLTKALAKYFGAKLLIFDSHTFLGALSAKEAELLKDDLAADKSSWSAKQSGVKVRFMPPSAASPSRGPTAGMRGKVVLPFEDNPISKIGVRFDKPIPGGVDLGHLCELDHGFFCNAHDLRLENPGTEDLDRLLINTLFEAISCESTSCPFILHIKDAEKCTVGNSEAFSTFRSRLEKLPDNVVVIGSCTQNDNRKEKSHPGGLMFTKFGSSPTALLDLAFSDSLGRLHDTGKDIPRATKLLTKLFPNKVTIHMPQVYSETL